MEYVVIYERGDSSYGAYVPDLPGCITVGDTLEEVQTLIQEAIEFHIEGLQEDGDDVPQPSLNIPIQYDIPCLGVHKVVENYVHNDDPALFSCKDAAGHLYLVTVGGNDKDKTWLRVEISNERFNLIRSGGIDLRNAFIDNENGYLFRIKVPHNDPTQSSPEAIHPDEIPEDLLPFPGERLGLKTDAPLTRSSPEESEKYITPEAYLASERRAKYKSEYIHGEVLAISGASRAHNIITVDITTELNIQLRPRSCEIYSGDMRVKTNSTGSYFYPDVVVVCDKPQFEDNVFDTLLNPILVVEVLSPSTEVYDKGEKFAHYQELASLREYILVSQDRIRVEHYRLIETQWVGKEFHTSEDVLLFDSIECKLPLQDIYTRVTLSD